MYQNNFSVSKKYIGLELWFTLQKQWSYGKNGTIEKTMIIYQNVWNFDLLSWQTYGTLEIKLWLTCSMGNAILLF